jgi:ubiquinone/menaquinone biosynthesis C-methylase UbiE
MARQYPGYAYDNASRHAVAHHDALSELLDQTTQAIILDRLDTLGGRRCLDVGAGGGSIASWLAEQVGERGSVTATDINPRCIIEHPRLRVLRHDITTAPLPGGPYDLITARLLLNHLPARREVLSTLAAGLTPGGVLLTEDFDPPPAERMIASAPDDDAAKLLIRFLHANREVLARHGGDSTWASRAYQAMVEEGLTDVETVVHGRTWAGGEAGCRLLAAGMAQTRHELLALGMTMPELHDVLDLLDDPRLALHGLRVGTTSGHKRIE